MHTKMTLVTLSTSIRTLVAALTCASLLLATHTAAANPLELPKRGAARAHLEEGNKLYHIREFERAVEEFKAGMLIEDAPVFHYNLAQAYRQLGRYKDAIWHYDRFMWRARPTGELKAGIDAFIVQMKSELEKEATTERQNETQAGTGQPQLVTAPVAPQTPRMRSSNDGYEPWYTDKLGWGIVGVGVVGASVSMGLFVSAEGLRDDANQEQGEVARIELRDRADRRRTIGTLAGIGSGFVVAAGLVKLVMRTPQRANQRVGIGAGVGHIFVTGRF